MKAGSRAAPRAGGQARVLLHQQSPGAGQHGGEEIHIQTLAPMTVPIAPRHQHHPIKGGTRRQRIEGAPHMQRMEGHAPSLEALAERWRQKEGFLPCSGPARL